MSIINEPSFVLAEGVASAEEIDSGMKLGAIHPQVPAYSPDLINNRDRTNPGSIESDSISSFDGTRSRSVTT